MNDSEKLRTGYGPIGLAASSGFSWARLTSGVFTVAISLAISWPASRPADLARMAAPQAKEPPVAVASRDTPVHAVTAAEMVRTQAVGPPKRPPPRSPNVHPRARAAALVQRETQGNPWASDYHSGAPIRLTRTRSEVRREFIAARGQVAAMTGEDSGSAYLTQVTARRSAKRVRPQARFATARAKPRAGVHPGTA